MVANGYAVWDGRKKQNIRFTVSMPVLLTYIRMMRFKPTPEARGLDSKTHSFTGPRTYKHIRNEHYFGGVYRVLEVTESEAA